MPFSCSPSWRLRQCRVKEMPLQWHALRQSTRYPYAVSKPYSYVDDQVGPACGRQNTTGVLARDESFGNAATCYPPPTPPAAMLFSRMAPPSREVSPPAPP